MSSRRRTPPRRTRSFYALFPPLAIGDVVDDVDRLECGTRTCRRHGCSIRSDTMCDRSGRIGGSTRSTGRLLPITRIAQTPRHHLSRWPPRGGRRRRGFGVALRRFSVYVRRVGEGPRDHLEELVLTPGVPVDRRDDEVDEQLVAFDTRLEVERETVSGPLSHDPSVSTPRSVTKVVFSPTTSHRLGRRHRRSHRRTALPA